MVETEGGLLFFGSVAFEAVILKDGGDLFFEVDGGGTKGRDEDAAEEKLGEVFGHRPNTTIFLEN